MSLGAKAAAGDLIKVYEYIIGINKLHIFVYGLIILLSAAGQQTDNDNENNVSKCGKFAGIFRVRLLGPSKLLTASPGVCCRCFEM